MSKAITVNDVTRYCDLLALGTTAAEAAQIVGRSVSALGNAARDTWPELYEEAKLKRADLVRNRIWEKFEQDDDAATMRWAGDHLVKWYVPEGRDTLELTGSTQVEVTVEHDFGRLLDKLAQVGLIQPGAAAALDAPDLPVLPARTD